VIALFVTIALGTLASEDLACVGAGVLVADGRIGLGPAALACFVGIAGGDIAIYAVARLLGRRALAHPVAARFVDAAAVARCEAWLERRGTAVVILSRFLPGTRVATYVAAGALGASAVKFTLAVGVATALWAPALVAISALLGERAVASGLGVIGAAVAALAVAVAAARIASTTVDPFRRALLVVRVRRALRWEFWPPALFYPPVALYVAWLAIRHGGFGVAAAANPGIDAGGLVGESKFEILTRLGPDGRRVARSWLVAPGAGAIMARAIAREAGLTFPFVLKPDLGQRGDGVAVVRSAAEVDAYFGSSDRATVLQEYVPGVELGLFYARRPGERRGRVTSITEKRFPEVTGDGRRSLAELVLDDRRASLSARAYFARLGERVDEVPERGERVRLVEIGSHCRGALFLDGERLRTPELEAAVEALARRFDGFFYGRFDVRAASIDAAMGGEITAIELNGLTSEPTHIYDPSSGLFAAYEAVFAHWRLAFEIGAENVRRGAPPLPVREIARRVGTFLGLEPTRRRSPAGR
jgi:membrane protein DedA with SNARE-associated domain